MAFEDERAEGRAIVRVHILDPAALATSSQALVSFWPYGDVEAGHVTIVLANLLELGMVRCWVGRGFDSRRSHASLWYSLTRIRAKRRRQGPIRLEFQAAFVTGDS